MVYLDDRVVTWSLIVVLAIFVSVAYHFARIPGGASSNALNQLKVSMLLAWVLFGFTTLYWGYYVLNKTGLVHFPGIYTAARGAQTAKEVTAALTPNLPVISGGKTLTGGRRRYYY